MGNDSIEETLDFTVEAGERFAPLMPRQEREFWAALACAALLHATLFIGITGFSPRVIGDAKGDPEAISVSLISEADYLSKTTAPTPADSPPAAPVNAPPPPPPEMKPAVPEPAPEPAVETTPPIPPEVVKQEVAKPETEKEKIEKEVPDLLSLEGPGPPAKTKPPAEKQPAVKEPAAKEPTAKKPPQKLSKLDLSVPPPSFNAPSGAGGRSASFERPPGVTRSGLNDDFARKVIGALQATMPQLRDTLGRVTVRILLTENGNVLEVQLVNGAPDPSLNQSVVFAAKQTSYPIPPTGSTVADRTFKVTYVYELYGRR